MKNLKHILSMLSLCGFQITFSDINFYLYQPQNNLKATVNLFYNLCDDKDIQNPIQKRFIESFAKVPFKYKKQLLQHTNVN